MKRIALLLSFGFFVLTACNNPQSYSSENAKNQTDSELSTVVGGKDVHGRQTATGEIWSELNRNCMQAFSVAQRLNPVGVKEGEAIISAFVLFSEDKSKVELFLREEKMVSTITERSEDNVYQGGEYKFDAHESVLYINGEKKYDGKGQ
ncbi:MAG: hypothetical protein H3C48_11640 [Chitinophagaceae bacterium]|nr:hypothetical protein [Chitinophagaceae bacterium]